MFLIPDIFEDFELDSMNVGEQIVSDYLSYIKECEFIQKNLQISEVQGEIDVIGINLKKKELYVCEVAIHLTTGLRYTKNSKSNNVEKIYEKFEKGIQYAQKYFPDYKKFFMFWTPIVHDTPNAKNNQIEDIRTIISLVKENHDINLEFIINDKFLVCLKELRVYAKNETKALNSPVMRFLQIEESLTP